MSTIIIKPRNRKEEDTLKKILKALDADFVLDDNESLSPSNDPYFDDPKNVQELNKRIADLRSGKEKTIVLTEELNEELFGV